MRLGLHIPDFTLRQGASTLAGRMTEVARAAEDAGFERLSVMDHVWQIAELGPPTHEMLEAYTTLGFLAAQTQRIKLLTVVTAAVFRPPGLLAKSVSTLDVLSGGRAMLGIGAAWYEAEARGLGLPFPPLAERFERLEETLQICLQMWSEDNGAYDGRHYALASTLNSPQPLTTPRPPIVIGGAGEKKTLRLVAKYADACNLFDSPELGHKLDVLRRHCDREGRDFDTIEKTVMTSFDIGPDGSRLSALVAHLRELSAVGIDVAHGYLPVADELRHIELMGAQAIPSLASA